MKCSGRGLGEHNLNSKDEGLGQITGIGMGWGFIQPEKIKMGHNNGGLDDDFPFQYLVPISDFGSSSC